MEKPETETEDRPDAPPRVDEWPLLAVLLLPEAREKGDAVEGAAVVSSTYDG